MNSPWMTLWTVVWFGGLLLFTVLAVLVIFGGGKDVASLLLSLRERHRAAQGEEPVEEG
jgi:hypothetical protein